MWVPPFRYLRISGYLLLPAAFRSLSRLSSALSARASSLCSFLLNLFFCLLCIALHFLQFFLLFLFLFRHAFTWPSDVLSFSLIDSFNIRFSRYKSIYQTDCFISHEKQKPLFQFFITGKTSYSIINTDVDNEYLYKSLSTVFLFLIWQPPALPHRLQCSTIGRPGLNSRVRDGYACFPGTHHRQISLLSLLTSSLSFPQCLPLGI